MAAAIAIGPQMVQVAYMRVGSISIEVLLILTHPRKRLRQQHAYQ
jgi:hypothetical protein